MADLKPTLNQQRAIASRGTNLVVVAGAGAGKTRVLVERYLALLDDAPNITALVAITFTEKAAREMRDRVRGAIEARAATDDRWAKFLREIDAARISTIHSLCATILRANAAEACVDPRFDVLDEADAAIWQDEAIDATLTDLTERGGEALALLSEYDLNTVRETLANLFTRGAEVDDAFARVPNTADELVAEWRARLAQAQREGIARLLARTDWQDAATWIRQNSADAKDKLEILRAQDERLLDAANSLQGIRAIAEQPKAGNFGSAKSWDDVKLARAMHNTLVDLAREFCDQLDLEFSDDDTRAAERVLQWRSLWTRARELYTARKNLERALDFNDLESNTRDLLVHQRAVRERYRAEMQTVLVDEYQDTNAAQRDIIFALASPDEPNRLFIVGDGKQSIYGFRGADVSVFTETRNQVRARWGDDAIIPLAESFRAHERLVGAFNDVFARIFAVEGTRADYEIAYEPMTPVRPPVELATTIEVLQCAGDSAENQRANEARELAARLCEMMGSHFQVWDKDDKIYRDAKWSDVALLFRASTAMPAYEDAFKVARIPYVTLAGKGYYDRAEVRDLVNLLRALDNPSDDLALAIVLRSPLFALSDETLYRLRREQKSFRAMLSAIPDDVTGAERARVEFARDVLENLWSIAGRVTILDSLTRALNATDYLATIASLDDGERRRGNVEKLLALARRTGLVRLSQFNAYLQDLTVGEVREGEAVVEAENAVRLMTIHAAKGLEFPIVVIPDASRAPRGHFDTLIADRANGVVVKVRDEHGKMSETVGYSLLKQQAERRDDAEEKRLLYVAATRAQDYLMLTGASESKKKSFLTQVLDALGGQTEFAWGNIKIHQPVSIFQPDIPEYKNEMRANVVTTDTLPNLAEPLKPSQVNALQWIAPTSLGMLVDKRDEFTRRFVEGAPERVTPIISERPPGYVIGEMAHRAIQRWFLPGDTENLDAILRRYAEERGLTGDSEIDAAVRAATNLLARFKQSDLYREMRDAPVRRHEVPFVVAWNGRNIYGALDAVYQTREGTWVVVDFKTDRLGKRDAKQVALAEYGVQLALYEYAAREKFGDVRVRVHFLHESEPIEISATDLAPALNRAREALTI